MIKQELFAYFELRIEDWQITLLLANTAINFNSLLLNYLR